MTHYLPVSYTHLVYKRQMEDGEVNDTGDNKVGAIFNTNISLISTTIIITIY